MPEISMRLLEASDLEWLRLLRNHSEVRCHLLSQEIILPDAQQAWYYESYAKSPDWFIFIAEDIEGNRVGYGQIRRSDNDSAELGLVVLPQRQGAGFGSAIVEWLLLYVTTQLCIKNIWLQVFEDNEKAVSLYKKCGFGTSEDLGDGKLKMVLQ